FSVRLCAGGLPLGAAAHHCFALPVRDVRPVDSHSLLYRIEVPVPAWVAPWVYDVGVRFPGGSDEAAAALLVEASGPRAPRTRAVSGVLPGGEGAVAAVLKEVSREPLNEGLAEAFGTGFRLQAPAGSSAAQFRVH